MKRKNAPFVALFFFPLLVLALNLHCQYDYSSPLPGLVDIRLHTISDSSRIAFSPQNIFVLKITQVSAVRSDLALATVYGDIKAIKRLTGVYNTLDAHAEDSSLVIGQADLPPGDYLGILMLIAPGGTAILDGYRNIRVVTPPGFDPTLQFQRSFKISEQRTTRIVLTINLDSSLVKEAVGYDPDTFLFTPSYYISSVLYE
ncbi:MAG TPA: hypothetical protein VES59_04720 [Bacteroidota bacterium]|nr:hypothetical protein [Bacteroidota bacterium]